MDRDDCINLAVFQGIDQLQASYYENDIAEGFVDFCKTQDIRATYRIFSPPLLPCGSRAWAAYGTGDQRDIADITEIESRVDDAMRWIARDDCPCALVGISNGCVAACEVALHTPNRVKALAFVSGMPEWSQLKILRRKPALPASFTVGSDEHNWKGGKSMYDAAYTLGADVLAFVGGHCKEGLRLRRHVGAHTASLALRGREDTLWPEVVVEGEFRGDKRKRSRGASSSSNSP
jgi:pimeloyl-ACP methyl ester carboxylesterase